MSFDWKTLETDVDEQLARAGVAGHPALALDRARIEQHARAIAKGELSKAANAVSGRVEAAGPGDVEALERIPTRERAELERQGRDAITRGRVAVAVLNGGMATRFGGDVKGIVEAVAGRTFLEIKLAQARRLGPVPFLVMNSFATHARSLEFLAQRGLARDVEVFLQGVSLRLTPKGDAMLDDEGRVSLYAPGHGDFSEALVRSGLAARLAERGVETVVLSNIDNLGAELDPLLIGLHLARERALTAELAATLPGDAIALVGSGMARTYGVAPIASDGFSVSVAAVDPFNPNLVNDLTFALERDVRLSVADPERVSLLIRQHYGEAFLGIDCIVKISSNFLTLHVLRSHLRERHLRNLHLHQPLLNAGRDA